MKQLSFFLLFFGFIFNIQAQCSQLDAGPDATVNCTNNCTTLTATAFAGIGAGTETYAINADTPCPLPPNGPITPTTIRVDDKWSSVITLPFTFYFFGQGYNYLIVGDNGVVSFDINNAGPPIQKPSQFCEWQFSASLPSTDLFKNAIFGAYHDLYIRAGGSIKYYVSGDYPQRKFVLFFDNVAQYSCNNLHTTQRIVLYETSNVIDVQIDQKDLCSGWNNGNAVVGIQNEAGDVAYVAPGRNTSAWQVPASAPELWRFVPNFNPQTITFSYKWFDENTGLEVGNAASVNVCVTEDTTFRIEGTYTNPNTGQVITLVDRVTVFFDNQLGTPDLGADINECDNPTVTLDGTTTNATSYQWEKDGVIIPGETNASITVSDSGTYTVTAILGICENSDDIVVNIEPRPVLDLGSDIVDCERNTVTLTPTIANLSGNETYQWQKDGADIPGATNPTLDVTETGVYTVIVSNTIGCDASDDVSVTFDPYPELELGNDQIVCSYDTATVSSNITDGDSYTWEVNGTVVAAASNQTDFTLTIPGDYDVVLTLSRGTCTVTDSVHVKVLDPVSISATPIIYGELEVSVTGGLPPYKYAIDGVNFQSDNHFENLPDGDYTVYIKDANECEYTYTTPMHVTNLIYPPVFTPNGDGINDFWRVKNAENTPDAILSIYDRYGRLLKQMHTSPYEYWDGTFSGKPVNANDYWFSIVLPDGKVYKGHFSLIR